MMARHSSGQTLLMFSDIFLFHWFFSFCLFCISFHLVMMSWMLKLIYDLSCVLYDMLTGLVLGGPTSTSVDITISDGTIIFTSFDTRFKTVRSWEDEILHLHNICTTHGHIFRIFHFQSTKIGVVGTFGGIKKYLEGICFILIFQYVRAISYMRSLVRSLFRLTKLFD